MSKRLFRLPAKIAARAAKYLRTASRSHERTGIFPAGHSLSFFQEKSRFRTWCLFFSALFFLFAGHPAASAMGAKNRQFAVGMRTYGVWEEASKERFDIAVWYPAASQGRGRQLDGWQVPAAGATRPLSGFFPVVLVSHDTASSRFANNDIAIAVAATGNIVIAVTHNDDNVNSSAALYTAELMVKRPRQLLLALETVLGSPDLGPHADESRIGLLGVGFGAITVMQLAGVAPKLEQLYGYCERSAPTDVFCGSWSGLRLRTAIDNLPELYARHGDNALAPPLGLYAPQLEPASVPPSREVLVEPEKKKKEGMYAAIRRWVKEEEEIIASLQQNATAQAMPGETSGQEFLFLLDFQGGDRLGGTISGERFVGIELTNLPLLRVNVEKAEEPSDLEETAPQRLPDNRTHRRPASLRSIHAIGLLAPAGGMLFDGKGKPVTVPGAIAVAGHDNLYPYASHGTPYEHLFTLPPQVEVFSGADHFSLFAPCTQDLSGSLEESCGTVRGEARVKLNEANQRFFSLFFLSTLGGAFPQPEPSGLVAMPEKKAPPVQNATTASPPVPPAGEKKPAPRRRAR